MSDIFILQATAMAVKRKVHPYVFMNGMTFDPAEPYVQPYFLRKAMLEDMPASRVARALLQSTAFDGVCERVVRAPKPDLRYEALTGIYPYRVRQWDACPATVELPVYKTLSRDSSDILLQDYEELLRMAYLRYFAASQNVDVAEMAVREVDDVWLEKSCSVIFVDSETGAAASFDREALEWFVWTMQA